MEKNKDILFMRRALELAWKAKGQTSPNPAVGAVIVKNGKIIAEGYHKKAGMPHAEAEALKIAGNKAKGSTVYVTLEPCSHFGKTPPCSDALIKAGVKKVVAAHKDPFTAVSGKGFQKLKKAGIEVVHGILAEEAMELNEDFIKFHSRGKVFVHLKWAMTLDGRTSADTGDSKWISNDKAREAVHQMRSWYDGILVGGGTLRKDDPELNVRIKGYKGKQPVRIIIDDILDLNPRYKIFNSAGGKVLILTTKQAYKKKANALKGINAEIIAMPHDKTGINPEDILAALKERNIRSLFIEGGRVTAGSFFEKKLIDRVTVFISPKICGGNENKSPIITPSPSSMISGSVNLDKTIYTFYDDNICIDGYPVYQTD